MENKHTHKEGKSKKFITLLYIWKCDKYVQAKTKWKKL